MKNCVHLSANCDYLTFFFIGLKMKLCKQGTAQHITMTILTIIIHLYPSNVAENVSKGKHFGLSIVHHTCSCSASSLQQRT